MALISLMEYAARHGKGLRATRRKAQAGNFETAKKIGRNWIIDENEPYVDYRVKSGKYVDWRKRQNANKR